jgi:hypothetical protein
MFTQRDEDDEVLTQDLSKVEDEMPKLQLISKIK